MFDLKDASGQPFFVTMRVGLLCPKCMEENKSSCPHVIAADTRPPWQSDLKQDLVKALYHGRDDLRQAEIMGATVDDHSACYKPAEIKNFLSRTLSVPEHGVKKMLTAMDPNGGGAGSDAALITLCLVRNNLCVLAVSAGAVRGYDAISELVCSHLTFVGRTYPHAQNVLAVENNLGNEASWVAAEVRRKKLHNVLIAHEKAEQSGVRTTAPRKALYVGELQRYLCTNSIGLAPKMRWLAEASPEKLEGQLCCFKRISRTNKVGTVTQHYSGKGSGPDDLALTLSLGAYWLLQYHQRLLLAER